MLLVLIETLSVPLITDRNFRRFLPSDDDDDAVDNNDCLRACD
jgi:hypothetical protein